ncbi:MAG: hypothetical protein Q7S08_01055 [bacterium]|nr:hypothetical protein [bacterium]
MTDFFGKIKKTALSMSARVKKPVKKSPSMNLCRPRHADPTSSTQWIPVIKKVEKRPNLLLAYFADKNKK